MKALSAASCVDFVFIALEVVITELKMNKSEITFVTSFSVNLTLLKSSFGLQTNSHYLTVQCCCCFISKNCSRSWICMPLNQCETEHLFFLVVELAFKNGTKYLNNTILALLHYVDLPKIIFR